jgi:hypothetical protein
MNERLIVPAPSVDPELFGADSALRVMFDDGTRYAAESDAPVSGVLLDVVIDTDGTEVPFLPPDRANAGKTAVFVLEHSDAGSAPQASGLSG